MSQNQLIRKSEKKIDLDEQQFEYTPVIDVFEPEYIAQLKTQQKLRKFYYPLEFPFCGDYPQPDLRDVQQRKKSMGQPFAQNRQSHQKQKLISFDGTFQEAIQIDENSPEIIRQKARMARDARSQFFESSGDFIVEKQFFQEQLARLANISFEENMAIKTFHKNAILSERNNQKKSTSFQLVLNFGGIFLTKHPLQNDQQKKFQELRPLLKEWSIMTSYPILPELSKQIDFLRQIKQNISQKVGQVRGRQQLNNLQKKLRVFEDMYDKERRKMEDLAKNIISKWKQLKQIRTTTGMQTVPWRVNIKEYEIPEQRGKGFIKNYDIGLSQVQDASFSNNESSQAMTQKYRRLTIEAQQYFIRVFINDNQVAKTDKFSLQWPTFKVPIHEQISITVYSAPYNVAIQIVKSGFINQVIDTVTLNLPGVNSKTITASERKFAFASFASNGKETRNRKQRQDAKAPSGIILYMMEWKGQGSRMPPSIFAKVGEQDTQSTQVSEDFSDKISQSEVTERQIKQLFDVRDPRLQQRTLKQKVEDEINQGSNALLPFSHVQSTRLLFLRLRNRISELQKIQIPLLEEQFEKRQDLREILQRQKRRNRAQVQEKDHSYFHPCQNRIFNQQSHTVLQEIRSLLGKIEGLKLFTSSRGLSLSTMKYKIVEQIINQHIFQQMESPIVVFFKDLFTQKRKLGPKSVYKAMPRINFDQIQINIHVRSARNLPIRSNAEESINQFEKGQKMIGGMVGMSMGVGGGMGMGMGGGGMAMGMGGGGGGGMFPQMGGYYPNNRDMYSNYGAGLFNQNPTFSMTGHTYFHQNQNNPNRINQEVNYDSKTMQRVNTVVEMKFKKNLKRTQCFQGPFPEWNQTLTFNYNVKGENSSIEKIFYNNEKLIKLLVFDITQESKPTNAIAKIEIKKTKYYLGRIQVPFSLITVIPSLSGLWKLDRPLIIFSYGIMKKQILADQNNYQGGQNYPSQSNDNKIDAPTLLNLDMFTQPVIDSFIAYNTDRKFIAGPAQESLLLQKASDWLQDLNTKRYAKLWLNDINQTSIFICRYLSKNVAPPKYTDHQIQRSARFVSFIPRKYNCQLLQNTEEFHLNVDELMKLKMGEDHGILLCNYFNYLDSKTHPRYESYLILGKAFPYGKTIFVLRRNKDTNDCEIWDPFKGESYTFLAKQIQVTCFCIKTQKKVQINYTNRDICPLFEATCIVSRDNVYVNKQESTNPYSMDFNLQNDDLWAPFLTDRTRNQYYEGKQIPTIQPEIDENYYLENFPQSRQVPAEIERSLFDFINAKISDQRKNHFTPLVYKLNTKASKKINDSLILQQCETFKSDCRMSGKDSKMYDGYQNAQIGLKQLETLKNQIRDTVVDSDKNLYGYTMNFTFTTFEEIWEKIEDSQIHLDENQNIEFVLCVKCFPYTCHLFSVWVFIGTIQ